MKQPILQWDNKVLSTKPFVQQLEGTNPNGLDLVKNLTKYCLDEGTKMHFQLPNFVPRDELT